MPHRNVSKGLCDFYPYPTIGSISIVILGLPSVVLAYRTGKGTGGNGGNGEKWGRNGGEKHFFQNFFKKGQNEGNL